MVGYSGTPLPSKLGSKTGARLLLVGAPDTFLDVELAELPDGVTVHTRAAGAAYDVLVVFVRSGGRVAQAPRTLDPANNPGRATLGGLVDNRVAAIAKHGPACRSSTA